MVIAITNAHRPVFTTSIKVLGTKVKEGYLVAHGGLHIDDEGHDVRNRLGIRIIGNATAKDTARPFDDPQVLAERTAIQVNADLLCPEGKEVIEAIDRLRGIAVMPAINEADIL